MSSMGLFEMDGGVTAHSELDLTSPLFAKITISLDSRYYQGKEFVIEAVNHSSANRYIKSARLNGKLLKNLRIPFSAIVNGGKLVLEMTDTPMEWVGFYNDENDNKLMLVCCTYLEDSMKLATSYTESCYKFSPQVFFVLLLFGYERLGVLGFSS